MAPTLPDGLRITHHPPASEPVDLTELATAASWASGINGGFGAATITIPRALTLKERGTLGMVTLEHEGRVLFEGRVEDDTFKWGKSGLSTDLLAFGLQRILTDNSIRKVWSVRGALQPQTASVCAPAGAMTFAPAKFDVVYGTYDTLNLARFGFKVRHIGTVDLGPSAGFQVGIAPPPGITAARLMFDMIVKSPSAAWKLKVYSSSDLVNYSTDFTQATDTTATVFSVDVPLSRGTVDIRVSGVNDGGGGVTADPTGASTYIEVFNLRLLCSATREDTSGGFYGSTILRDAISFAPGIYPGTIENGTELVLPEFARVDRTSILDVVQEITPLYAREWGVWEGGRFDWVTPDLKSPGWVVPIAATTDGQIERSIDSLHRRTYVPFTDAADQQQKEAFVESQSARNPYVLTGANKDGIVQAPAAMTAITAPLLAAKLNNDFGRWPDIKGSVNIIAGTMIRAANGAREVPAFAIRAGDNITIPDLPVEDLYATGQDGQTVFHVSNVKTSTSGDTELTLEGLTRRADVLMARLALVSR